jgi:acyl carrier protein
MKVEGWFQNGYSEPCVRRDAMVQTVATGQEQIRKKVRSFIRDSFLLAAENSDFKAGDSFLERGIIDSTGVLELVNFIEETFSISVEDEELVPENLDSLDRISSYIERKMRYARQ